MSGLVQVRRGMRNAKKSKESAIGRIGDIAMTCRKSGGGLLRCRHPFISNLVECRSRRRLR